VLVVSSHVLIKGGLQQFAMESTFFFSFPLSHFTPKFLFFILDWLSGASICGRGGYKEI
jgi:hypothetical protein